MTQVAIKWGIALYWVGTNHHFAPVDPPWLDHILFWISKLTLPGMMLAFLLDARQIGANVWVRFYAVLLVVTVIMASFAINAKLHGTWHGWAL